MACTKVCQDFHETTFKTFLCCSLQLLMGSLRKTTISLCRMLLSEFVSLYVQWFEKVSRKTFSNKFRFYIFNLWLIQKHWSCLVKMDSKRFCNQSTWRICKSAITNVCSSDYVQQVYNEYQLMQFCEVLDKILDLAIREIICWEKFYFSWKL